MSTKSAENQIERWQNVSGFEGSYAVSESGRVRSMDRVVTCSSGAVRVCNERELYQSKSRGYLRVRLYKEGQGKTIAVHRLVALAFVANPQGHPAVNHIDGNRANNSASNLEWVTAEQNNAHSVIHLGRRRDCCLSVEQIAEIRSFPRRHGLGVELAARYGVPKSTMQRVISRKSYHSFYGPST